MVAPAINSVNFRREVVGWERSGEPLSLSYPPPGQVRRLDGRPPTASEPVLPGSGEAEEAAREWKRGRFVLESLVPGPRHRHSVIPTGSGEFYTAIATPSRMMHAELAIFDPHLPEPVGLFHLS